MFSFSKTQVLISSRVIIVQSYKCPLSPSAYSLFGLRAHHCRSCSLSGWGWLGRIGGLGNVLSDHNPPFPVTILSIRGRRVTKTIAHFPTVFPTFNCHNKGTSHYPSYHCYQFVRSIKGLILKLFPIHGLERNINTVTRKRAAIIQWKGWFFSR